MSRALFVLAFAFVWGVACSAFEDLPDQQPCMDIPQKDGCVAPELEDASPMQICFEDETCTSVYACENESWVLLATCPAHSKDAGMDANHVEDVRSGGRPRDVDFELPPGASGGPGCIGLQCGDCPLSLGLACPSDQCCGCQDLYVCEDGGWNVWGYCDDGGAIEKASSP
jgi:hypothetical protein